MHTKSVMLNAMMKTCNYIDAALTSECARPGDTLSYECTFMESGYIIWTGTAFICSSTNNNIILSGHYHTGTSRTCNNGAIVARILSAEGNNYTSQLNVTVTSDTAGKTIECINYERGAKYYRFNWTIPILTGLSFASCLCLIISTHHNRATKHTRTL